MAHVEKLINYSHIRPEDGEALERFSVSLSSCKNVLLAMGYLNKIENPESMRKIIEKLPRKLQERWRDTADTIISVNKRDVTIKDIADFLQQKARSLMNPVFGKLPSDAKSEGRSRGYKPNPIRQSNFAINADNIEVKAEPKVPVKACPICDKLHSIYECFVFKKKSQQERLELVSLKRLCFSCLRRGHQSVCVLFQEKAL